MNAGIRIIYLFIVIFSAMPFIEPQEPLINQLGANSISGGEKICRVPIHDLIASAQSTANRILKGICNPREMTDRFATLETQIVDQFNVLKTMVLNIEDKLRDQDERIKSQHRKLHRSLAARLKKKKNRANVKENSPLTAKTDSNPYNKEDNYVYDYYEEGNKDFLYDDDFAPKTPSPREEEIAKFNSTILISNAVRIFTYYWTIRDIPYRMDNWGWRRSLRSESFYIFEFGYRMFMSIFPNQEGKNIYIHVGITQGEFDDGLDWPFKLKHKIQLMDNNLKGADMSSRVWDPTELCSGWNWKKPVGGDNYNCVGLGFSKETVYNRHYLHNDSITIKLTVFLD